MSDDISTSELFPCEWSLRSQSHYSSSIFVPYLSTPQKSIQLPYHIFLYSCRLAVILFRRTLKATGDFMDYPDLYPLRARWGDSCLTTLAVILVTCHDASEARSARWDSTRPIHRYLWDQACATEKMGQKVSHRGCCISLQYPIYVRSRETLSLPVQKPQLLTWSSSRWIPWRPECKRTSTIASWTVWGIHIRQRSFVVSFEESQHLWRALLLSEPYHSPYIKDRSTAMPRGSSGMLAQIPWFTSTLLEHTLRSLQLHVLEQQGQPLDPSSRW